MTTTPWMKATRQWQTLEAPASSVEIVEGAQDLQNLRGEFHEWTKHHRLPITGTSSWLFPAVIADDGTHPWAVVVRGISSQLQGLVVLLDETIDGFPHTCLAGTDQGNRGVICADTPELAEEMAQCVARVLSERLLSHRVVLGPLDAGDPCVHAFASALPRAQLVVADPIPVIRQDSPKAVDYLSQGMRRTLRKAHNRLAKDGRESTVRYTKDADEIFSVIPQLERVHRDRDHVHGRPSDLDDHRARQMWFRRLQELGQAGDLELATLQIDGQFAAHALGATDYPVYRVIEGRFVTEWARYAPGRLLEAAVLQRVLDDESFHSLDWMTAVAPEKLLATNHADPMLLVHVGPSI